MAKSTRIAIIGVGGIGAYYVARLARSDTAVLAVARGRHLAAIRDHGLRVGHPQHPFNAKVPACDLDALLEEDPRGFQVIVLLTKATATAALALRLAAWMDGAPTPVLSLQNGVDNEVVLADALGRERVIGGYSVRLAGHVVAPGQVSCVGDCHTCIGVWPDAATGDDAEAKRVARIAGAFNAAGLATEVFPDIRRELWRKLVLNAAVNPLSALLGWDTKRLSHDPEMSVLVRGIMDETVAVGRADGIDLAEGDAQEMFELIHGFPAIKTSMLVDLERGREPEVDAICGALLARAEKHGVSVPYVRTITALLKAKLED